MEVNSIEVDMDHVHIAIQIPPQRSVGRAVGILKSLSARMMFKRFPYLKRKLWAGELWSDGYFARTMGEGVTAAMVKRYIDSHEVRASGPAQAELFPEGTT
jgi:putative transposase